MDRTIKKILSEEFGYSGKALEIAEKKIENLSPPLEKLWIRWMKDKQIENIEISGVSLKYLIEGKKLKFPAALFTLQWLLDSPEEAKKMIENPIK